MFDYYVGRISNNPDNLEQSLKVLQNIKLVKDNLFKSFKSIAEERTITILKEDFSNFVNFREVLVSFIDKMPTPAKYIHLHGILFIIFVRLSLL